MARRLSFRSFQRKFIGLERHYRIQKNSLGEFRAQWKPAGLGGWLAKWRNVGRKDGRGQWHAVSSEDIKEVTQAAADHYQEFLTQRRRDAWTTLGSLSSKKE